MKKIFLFIALMALTLVVVACGTTKDDANKVEKDTVVETEGNTGSNPDQTENTGDQEDMESKMDELDYTEFNLGVDYAKQKEYEVELEKNSDNSIEAEIDDSINNVKKKGAEAFHELYPLVKQLTIVQETTKEEAINEVLKVFNLEDNYSELDLDITFKDGTKIEFEDKK
ncbi:YusW family protein [Sporosarcina sp. G11-34]|uniref:YusW family protein n=1 Tax=Sporosarcina sp. G11-34 TaxID=2849605 RepID=UPI0022A99D0F|nr:YusW family protein [Sporosarcina sp. G11-34]MCZ2259585.1 YusW family protein [Sporosarcina sp. G11-34]